jgi:hypothetical protein
MAKTALAYAKKASYIGKKVVVAVKATGDGDPNNNRALAAVMREANALDVPKVRAHEWSFPGPIHAGAPDHAGGQCRLPPALAEKVTFCTTLFCGRAQ